MELNLTILLLSVMFGAWSESRWGWWSAIELAIYKKLRKIKKANQQ